MNNRPNWRDIFRGFSLALDPRKLFLGFLWIAFSAVGFEVLSIYVSGVHIWQVKPLLKSLRLCIAECQFTILYLTVAFIIWSYICWCFLAGAIYRIAAVEMAKEQRISLKTAICFSGKRIVSFFLGVFLLIIFILVITGINAFIGWLAQILQQNFAPLGIILLWLLWLLLFSSSIMILFICLAVILTPGLIFCSIAVDNKDHYDAISQSFGYCFYNFWHYLFYHIIALCYAIPTTLFAIASGIAIWHICIFSLQLGMGEQLTGLVNIYDFLLGTTKN